MGVIDDTNLGHLWDRICAYVDAHSGGGGGGGVTGVKGDAESSYRSGNVSLTPANLGAAEASHTHAISDVTGLGARYLNGGDYKISTAGIDTLTAGPSVTVPAGTYVFTGMWAFNTGASSGQRNLQVGFRTGADGGLWTDRARVMAAANNYAALSVTAINTLSETSTVYLVGSSSMKTNSTSGCRICAVRIA